MQRLNKKSISFRIKAIFLASVMVTLVSGCSVYQPSYGPTVLRNKITVAETVERLELYAGTAGLHLSVRDQDAVGGFIAQYAATGEGPLYINVPRNSANSPGVNQANAVIQSHLGRMGLPSTAIQSGQYAGRPGGASPVIVSYRRLTTVPVDCHQGANLTHTFNNQPYNNFGCAQTANLAALIDNPRQLLAPYTWDNASTVRRVTVINSFNNGEPTSTPRPDGQEIITGG